MIEYVQGDIFGSDELVIAHGCNCHGGFGSGFAKTVAKLYPQVKDAYLQRYHELGWRLGEVQVLLADEQSGRFVANCTTQDRYGRQDEGPYVSYPAVRKVIRELVKRFPQGFAMPKMGAGLAGGNWEIIERIIEEETGSTTTVRVYVLPTVSIKE